jgi:hypothetical protein
VTSYLPYIVVHKQSSKRLVTVWTADIVKPVGAFLQLLVVNMPGKGQCHIV